jgi:YebC/PmpR family DNA-binding regulatory protein
MSGHSKWATTKRQKAVVDSKRGAIFTKLGKLITIAARKGGDQNVNFALRMAIDKAKAANMPKENIERAIKRGTGELDSESIDELIYEGFGPAKSQFIIKCLTSNKNRSAAEIRHLFTKNGGSMGSVMWNFIEKGVIRIAGLRVQASDLELELIDSGAQDILQEEEGVTIYTKTEDLQKVKKFLEDKEIITESAELEYIPKEMQKLSNEDREKVENFIEELEESEDVGDFYTNAEI